MSDPNRFARIFPFLNRHSRESRGRKSVARSTPTEGAEGRTSAYVVSGIWLLSFYIWINTIAYQLAKGERTAAVIFVAFLLLSIVLYLAEGAELAVAELRDKDAGQFRDASTREVMTEIKKRDQFFFSQRQIFVVAIISFISIIISTYMEQFYVYGIGTINKPITIGIINFIFINIWVLCACQVAPKRLALLNSERFLAQSSILWPLIKVLGKLNIPGPSDLIVKWAKGILRFPPRKLLPSRPTHYNIAAQLHGYCLDQFSVRIVLHNDGSAEICRDYLYMFLHGRRKSLAGQAKAGEPPRRFINSLDVIEAWTLPAVEDLREYEGLLNRIFNSRQDREQLNQVLTENPVQKVDIAGRGFDPIIRKDDESSDNDWEIRFLDEIPERINHSAASPTAQVVCLLYSARGETAPGAFYTGNSEDFWTERISAACRRMSFDVSSEGTTFNVRIQSCDVGLEHADTRLTEESGRCETALREDGAIPFPIQSAMYKFNWETMLRQAS
jgi:hypothetical protein